MMNFLKYILPVLILFSISAECAAQKNVMLTEVPFYDIKSADTQDFKVIGYNSSTLFALRHLKDYEGDSEYSKVRNIGWLIEGYSIESLSRIFTVPVEIPIENTEWISLHDYFPLDDGLGLFISFYDKAKKARIVAVSSIDNEGTFNDEMTIIETVPGNKERRTAKLYIKNLPGQGTVITENFGSGGATGDLKKSETQVITLMPDGGVNFSNTPSIEEDGHPAVYANLVGATTNGNVLFSSYRTLNGKASVQYSMLNGEMDLITRVAAPDFKERFSKRYNGIWDSFFKEIPGKGSLFVQLIKGKYKYEKRIIAFRLVHFSREGKIISDRILEVVEDETHEDVKDKYADKALHGSILNSISIAGDELIMTATREPYRKQGIGRVSEVRINYVNGAIMQRSCERSAIMNEDWSETRALAYHFNGSTYHIGKLPSQWVGKDCESTERLDKKAAKDLTLAWTVSKLTDSGNIIQELTFGGQTAETEMYAFNVSDIKERRLGIFRTVTKKNNDMERYYIGWLE